MRAICEYVASSTKSAPPRANATTVATIARSATAVAKLTATGWLSSHDQARAAFGRVALGTGRAPRGSPGIGAASVAAHTWHPARPVSVPPISDVSWERGHIDRAARWRALGVRGATVWFTGLPASGKSTVAGMVEGRLVEAGVPAYRLDGDNLRHGINEDLG